MKARPELIAPIGCSAFKMDSGGGGREGGRLRKVGWRDIIAWRNVVRYTGFKMMLKARIDDALCVEIDAAAQQAGVSRSQFARAALEEKLRRQGAVDAVSPHQRTGEKKSIHVQLVASETDAIDRAAACLGMKRNQWIVKRIRGALWDGKGNLYPSPSTADAIGGAVFQLQQIGRNLNQAVRAVNASAMPESGMNQPSTVANLVRMKDEVQSAIDAATAAILAAANGERAYWTHAR